MFSCFNTRAVSETSLFCQMSFLMLLFFFPFLLSAEVSYEIVNGNLTISGDGNITQADVNENTKDKEFHNVIIDGNIQTICEKSFYFLDSIEYVEITAAVTKIETSSFRFCSNLKTIILPETLQTISLSAFESAGLTSVTIPEQVTIIESLAFSNCKNLENITFLGSPEKVNSDILSLCTSLSHIEVPSDSKLYYSENGVLYDKSMTTLFRVPPAFSTFTIPSNITAIGAYCFDSSSVESFSIPENIKEIHHHAFNSAKQIKEILIPETVKNISSSLFISCSNLETIIINAPIDVIPSFFARGCSKLTKIVFPQSVETIGQFAFQSCSLLHDIEIPDSLKSLEQSVFRNTALVKVILPESMRQIGASCFMNCNKLQEIVFPHTILQLGINIFAGCTALTNVALPTGCSSLPERIFFNSNKMQSIVISDSFTSIGKEAFRACSSLEEVVFSAELESIGSFAFFQTNVKSVSFGPKLKTIFNSAFDGVLSLRSVTFNSSLNIIERGAFNNTNIEALELIGSPKLMPFSFSFTPNLKKVNFDRVQSLGIYSFHSSGFEELTIPEHLNIIEESAFRNCTNLRVVTIHSDSIAIGNNAFAYCPSLKLVYIYNNVASINPGAFNGTTHVDELIYCGTRIIEYDIINIYAVTVSHLYNSTLFAGLTPRVHPQACGLITPTPVPPENQIGTKGIIIIGCCVGCAVLLITIIVLSIFLCRRNKKEREYLSESLLAKV